MSQQHIQNETEEAEERTEMTTNDNKQVDWKSIAATWLTQQGVSTILLFCTFVSGWYGAAYLVNVAIPAHIASVKEGYAKYESSHREERDERDKRYYLEREDRDKRYTEEREKDRSLLREFLFNGNTKKNGSAVPDGFSNNPN